MAYAVQPTDMILIVENNSSAPIDLPAATGTGRMLRVKNVSGSGITIQADGSELIDGSNTLTLADKDRCLLHDYKTGNWVLL